jgi:hypothetical protein
MIKTSAHDSDLNVIRWDEHPPEGNFHFPTFFIRNKFIMLLNVALAEASDKEWKILGGIPYKSNYKCDSTNLKEHLRWSMQRKDGNSVSSSPTKANSSAATDADEVTFSRKGFKWTEFKKLNLNRPPPFDTGKSTSTISDRVRDTDNKATITSLSAYVQEFPVAGKPINLNTSDDASHNFNATSTKGARKPKSLAMHLNV